MMGLFFQFGPLCFVKPLALLYYTTICHNLLDKSISITTIEWGGLLEYIIKFNQTQHLSMCVYIHIWNSIVRQVLWKSSKI